METWELTFNRLRQLIDAALQSCMSPPGALLSSFRNSIAMLCMTVSLLAWRYFHKRSSLKIKRYASKHVFGSPQENWRSLWKAHMMDTRCMDESWDVGPNTTFGAVIVELRVYPPLIHSLNLSHQQLPTSWPFHIFHANFTRDKHSEHWFLHGEMSEAIMRWRNSGRRVELHMYDDAWHRKSRSHRTRPSNTFPRMRAFWTKYFHEDVILTLQSDTALCPSSPYKLAMFTGVDWNGATWGSNVIERGVPGQGGLSLRNRHAMYNCIDWLRDKTQHRYNGRPNRDVLWDYSFARNEDYLFAKCMRGTRGHANIEDWQGRHLHYHVGGICLANKWSREHSAIDAIIKGYPPPFGLHSICRAIESYGLCKWVLGAQRGPRRLDEPPIAQAYQCNLKGFSVDRAVDAFSQYCGADLNYMRNCFDHNSSSTPDGKVELIEGRLMGRTLDAASDPWGVRRHQRSGTLVKKRAD